MKKRKEGKEERSNEKEKPEYFQTIWNIHLSLKLFNLLQAWTMNICFSFYFSSLHSCVSPLNFDIFFVSFIFFFHLWNVERRSLSFYNRYSNYLYNFPCWHNNVITFISPSHARPSSPLCVCVCVRFFHFFVCVVVVWYSVQFPSIVYSANEIHRWFYHSIMYRCKLLVNFRGERWWNQNRFIHYSFCWDFWAANEKIKNKNENCFEIIFNRIKFLACSVLQLTSSLIRF